MGVVYLGQHTLLGRRAAIKVLLPALSARADIVNRFFNEARAVTSISDPGIVQVFDFGYHTDGSAYIVMEYLEGEPLDRRLARLGRLPLYEALRLTRQVAGSLAAAHSQRIIHRDLKPENIFLVHDGEVASGERTKILDFGIAKLSDEHPGKVKTSTGALMGTPVYMSPEQCRGAGELDHRSDIYALGCVMFHLISGRPPFEGEGMGDIIAAHLREPAPSLVSRMPGVAPGVDALVLRCLAKSPADRYQTMTELATAIGQMLPYLTSPEAPTQYPAGYPGSATPPPPYASRPGTPPPPIGYASRPATPVPPHASRPGTPAPPSPHYASPGSHAATPVPAYPSYPGNPVPPSTTLGTSSGQLGSLAPTAPPPRPRRLALWIASVAVIGAASAGIAVVVTRSDGAAHGPAASRDAGIAAVAPPDAAVAAVTVPPLALDAAVADAAPLAAAVDAAVDAAVIDVPVDAPARRHHSTRPAGPRSGSGSGATTPPGCDRKIDTDCDGIPDVR